MARKRKKPAAVRIGARDLLWNYAQLARMYAIELLVVSLLLTIVSIILEATSEDGWSWTWLGTLVAITGITGLPRRINVGAVCIRDQAHVLCLWQYRHALAIRGRDNLYL